jgi:hypothetical protein
VDGDGDLLPGLATLVEEKVTARRFQHHGRAILDRSARVEHRIGSAEALPRQAVEFDNRCTTRRQRAGG